MRAPEEARSPSSGRLATRIAGAVLAAALVAACAGENTFPSFIVTAPQDLRGPRVDITAPQAGISIAPGDSVNLTANLVSQEGITEVRFSGVLVAGGAAAFTPVTVPLTPLTDTTMSRYMKRSGTTPGAAWLIVTARDVSGDEGADTLSVNLGS